MKINQKQLEKAMKQMGMQTTHIDAEEVIIKTAGKEIVITNPQVSRISMMGQETFQVTGDVEERDSISDEDVEAVVEETGVSKEEAEQMLRQTGDIAESIMRLKKE